MAETSRRQAAEGRTVEGFLRPVGEPAPGVPVRLHFREGRLSISGDSVGDLGTWEIADLNAARSSEGPVITIDGEELIANFDDPHLERALVETLIKRPWWFYAVPVVAGLVIALSIWAFAV